MTDINDLRDFAIQLSGLDKVDLVYTFYHDETNNIQKLRVTERGLNVAELQTFVLGGIAHVGSPRRIDITPLRERMRIQKTATEIKLTHVAKGDFLELLASTKLATFLRWISANELFVHYQALDPLYWSVVDIIDSILAELGNRALLEFHALLKADLVTVLRKNLPATVDLFRRYGYPGLKPESREPFLNDLRGIVDQGSDLLPPFNANNLRGVIQAGRQIDELAFIEGYPADLLIDNFSIFYMTRVALFKNSSHVLDMEESIKGHFLQDPLTDGGQPITNYRFVDSKSEPGIQLSDVIVGLLGKMHTYFTDNSPKKIAEDRAALNGVRLENAELLRDLISASHHANVAFLNHVESRYDIEKLDLFLRFKDGAYATI